MTFCIDKGWHWSTVECRQMDSSNRWLLGWLPEGKSCSTCLELPLGPVCLRTGITVHGSYKLKHKLAVPLRRWECLREILCNDCRSNKDDADISIVSWILLHHLDMCMLHHCMICGLQGDRWPWPHGFASGQSWTVQPQISLPLLQQLHERSQMEPPKQ